MTAIVALLSGSQSMVTKNNCYFNDDVVKVDLERLVNKIFKLLPMRENNEDW